MERGFSNTLPSSSSGLSNSSDANASNSNNNNSNSNTNTNNNDNDNRQEPPTRGHEHVMPVANLMKLMRRVLPRNAKVSVEARDTIQECVAEFINYVTGEANIHCHREKRKTINVEDLLWAMGQLGFESYVGPLTLYLNRYREAETGRPYSHGSSAPYMNGTVDYSPLQWVPNYGPNFNVRPQSQMFRGATMGGGVSGGPVNSSMDGSLIRAPGRQMDGSVGWPIGGTMEGSMGGPVGGTMGWPHNGLMNGATVGSMGRAQGGPVGGEIGGGVTTGSMGGGATGWLPGGATAWLASDASYYGDEAGGSSSSSPPPLPDFDPYDDLE